MDPMYSQRIEDNLPGLRERIAAAAERSGRSAEDVRLVAVTKSHPLEAVRAALDAGLDDLGENRVGELEWKTTEITDERARWHMIGHVQRRKAPRLIGRADLIHSLDSVRLAERYDRVAEDGHVFEVLVQANVSGEDAKYGFEGPETVEKILEVCELPGLRVRGLMTMAPFVEDEAVLRTTFVRLRELHETLAEHDAYEGTELSMGMTNDFEIAIEEGSTMVRIGTALLGPRPEQ